MRDCLQNIPIGSDIPNSPLTQTSAAQPEDVTENTDTGSFNMHGAIRPEDKTETENQRDHQEWLLHINLISKWLEGIYQIIGFELVNSSDEQTSLLYCRILVTGEHWEKLTFLSLI